MKIGMDIDGVLAAFNESWTAEYRLQYGESLFVENWDDPWRLTKFKAKAEFWDWIDKYELFARAEVMPGAQDGMGDLIHYGHDVLVITARRKDRMGKQTEEWLLRNNISYSSLHFEPNKWRLDCDVYVDDSPKFLERIAINAPLAEVVKFNQPWNMHLTNFMEVTNWSQLMACLTSLDSRGMREQARIRQL